MRECFRFTAEAHWIVVQFSVCDCTVDLQDCMCHMSALLSQLKACLVPPVLDASQPFSVLMKRMAKVAISLKVQQSFMKVDALLLLRDLQVNS